MLAADRAIVKNRRAALSLHFPSPASPGGEEGPSVRPRPESNCAATRQEHAHGTGSSWEHRPEGLAPLSRLHDLWLDRLALVGAGRGGLQALLPDRHRERHHLLR